MFASHAFVLALLWTTIKAQQFPYQPQDSLDAKGVCTINGKVYYGIDCWCYSGGLGTALVTISVITLVVFFFVSGCIWKGIFSCCDAMTGRKDDFEGGLPSLRSSMRQSMRKRHDPDTPI